MKDEGETNHWISSQGFCHRITSLDSNVPELTIHPAAKPQEVQLGIMQRGHSSICSPHPCIILPRRDIEGEAKYESMDPRWCSRFLAIVQFVHMQLNKSER